MVVERGFAVFEGVVELGEGDLDEFGCLYRRVRTYWRKMSLWMKR